MFRKLRPSMLGRNYQVPLIMICWLLASAFAGHADVGGPTVLPTAMPPESPLQWAQTIGFGGMLAYVLWGNYQRDKEVAKRAEERDVKFLAGLDANTRALTELVVTVKGLESRRRE